MLPGVYPWGNSMPPIVDGKPMGNYGGEEMADGNLPPEYKGISGYRDGFPRTSPVGTFPANAFGLYDMGGNVGQWCEDMLAAGSTERFSSHRVIRGGSWLSTGGIRSSFRDAFAPNVRFSVIGFRVVLAREKQDLPAP